METEYNADYTVENHGSIFIVQPMHGNARQHLLESVGEESLWYGGGLAVEHRYIADLVDGLKSDGFTVA